MTISSATAASSASSTSSATAALAAASDSAEQLNSQFLTLLVSQLNNQDPLQPLDNAQMTSQMAQMSTVSGIQTLNSTLNSLVSQTGSSQTLQAASLIGKGVLVAGNTETVSSGKATPFGVQLSGASDTTTVTITNSAGNVVSTMNLGAQSAGSQTLSWNGQNGSGQQVPDGTYQIAVAASLAGQSVTANALNYAQVSSVAQGTTGVNLSLSNGSTTALSNVQQFF
ncbi:flagellar hook assembly protein FlgD [Glaciimonas sp. PAMC28666]|uniref:flagellar hook assembly protein FlgD n=1 Tax=Glaciimonas sp. PAMC28666 TaxID=2807626 RepID=UPI0019622C87|nr:flagellar hook assembly protein FlgD [Glaciimonas sp. PAMC28666]QRX83140.1 flagellar hook assembly protein FlgD [Glaciimonas sp. PAMC28666]